MAKKKKPKTPTPKLTSKPKKKEIDPHSLIWGIIFIIIGILLTLMSYGLLTIESLADILKAWPLLFVVLGLYIIYKPDNKIEEVR